MSDQSCVHIDAMKREAMWLRAVPAVRIWTRRLAALTPETYQGTSANLLFSIFNCLILDSNVDGGIPSLAAARLRAFGSRVVRPTSAHGWHASSCLR